jgi:hypothetical protein
MLQAQTIFEYNTESEVGQAIKEIWRRLADRMAL